MRQRPVASVQESYLLLETVECSPQGGGVLILREGRPGAGAFTYRAVLAVEGVPLGDMTLGEQQAVLAGYAAFLNSVDYPLQLLVRSLPVDLDGHVGEVEERAARPDTPEGLAGAGRDYAAFVRGLAAGRSLLARRFYLVVGTPADPRAPAGGRVGRSRLAALGLPRPVELLAAPLDLIVATGRDFGRLLRRLFRRQRGASQPPATRAAAEAPVDPDSSEVRECRRRRAAADQLDARCRDIARQLARGGLAARRLSADEVAGLCAAGWAPARSHRRGPDGGRLRGDTVGIREEAVAIASWGQNVEAGGEVEHDRGA